MLIERVTSLEQYNLKLLLDNSISEGHKLIQKLLDEYTAGSNKFNKNGESLFVARIEDKVIGIGGLNIDPYLDLIHVGRVRHLYVLPKYRGSGVGKKLLRTIIEEAKKYFQTLTLYTDNPVADKLYRNSGFSISDKFYKASHVLELTSEE